MRAAGHAQRAGVREDAGQLAAAFADAATPPDGDLFARTLRALLTSLLTPDRPGPPPDAPAGR